MSGDIGEVMQVLKSDWLTQGPEVPEFEEVSNFLESPFALAVTTNQWAAYSLHALGVTKVILFGPHPIVLWHLQIVQFIVS